MSPWKAESTYSEKGVAKLAEDLAKQLKVGDRIFLEGELGAGKSTFTRYLLKALNVKQQPEGSPSFSIVHEYRAPIGGIAHIDFYRLGSNADMEAAGIPSYFWERKLLIITEWISKFPEFESKVLRTSKVWKIKLSLDALNNPDHRKIAISVSG